jgi:PD-(D/E)XK endonuclease
MTMPESRMKKPKPPIIEDKKQRGEWAESVFLARAHEHGLPVSKPWGELSSYDFIIGRTGRFVSVQVKSTLMKQHGGYACTIRGGHKAYAPGSFDFVAAYVVPADAWYILPATLVHGKRSIWFFPDSPTSKYERYREAWHLLREAAHLNQNTGEVPGPNPDQAPNPQDALSRNRMEQRMLASVNFLKKHWER